MLKYVTVAHRCMFTHLGIKLRQGDRDMVQIEQDILAGLPGNAAGNRNVTQCLVFLSDV